MNAKKKKMSIPKVILYQRCNKNKKNAFIVATLVYLLTYVFLLTPKYVETAYNKRHMK